jgi:hypothetical protein
MSSEPDWALYRTLLAVLDEGSLSGAARSLGLTQPTVARHIDALEAALVPICSCDPSAGWIQPILPDRFDP